jgi:hypothetical protein
MMLPTVLLMSSCDNGRKKVGEAGDASAQTLVIAAIKDKDTTDEALKAVEAKLNEITEAEFNTHVVLKFFTAEEYAQKIMQMSQSLEAKQKDYEAQLSGSAAPEDPREYDEDALRELGVDLGGKGNLMANGDYFYYGEFKKPMTVYPTVSDDQLDVIFIDSIDTYYQLVSNRYITCLNSDIAANNGFKKFTSGTMLNRVQKISNGVSRLFDATNGDIYAIPNNYVTDSANYLLINKKLFDHYNYDINCDNHVGDINATGIDDLGDLDMFFKEVIRDNATNPEGLKVDKILYNYSGLGSYSYSYYGDGQLSLYGKIMTKTFGTETAVPQSSSILNAAFKRSMTVKYELEKIGNKPYDVDCFYRDADIDLGNNQKFMVPRATMAEMAEAGQSFAVAMVTGDTKLPDYYSKEDYYVVRTGAYGIDNDMFKSMFAVSTFSTTAVDADGLWLNRKIENYEDSGNKNPRAFELIAMLQTNEEAINLLTYGIQGVDYDTFDNDETVYNAGKKGDYKPVFGLGNLFLTRPSDQMDARTAYYAANEWEAAKLQMRSSVCIPYCGFTIRQFEIPEGEEYGMTVFEIEEDILKQSEEIIKKINDFDGDYDDDGKEDSISDYIDALNKEFSASDSFKLAKQIYRQIDEEGHYTGPSYQGLPTANYAYFFFFVYQGLTGIWA